MCKFIDLTNKRFGKLKVIDIAYRKKENNSVRIYWNCICDCGNKTVANTQSLKNGHKKSCGCLAIEESKKRFSKHNMSRTRLYRIYIGMLSRCYNENNVEYKNYGKRGIVICDDWLNDKTKFFDWALNNGYEKYLTIDRIDNNGNYCPENCRWANEKTQATNRRDTVLITIEGKTQCLKDWCKEFKLSYNIVRYKLKKGFTIENIFNI